MHATDTPVIPRQAHRHDADRAHCRIQAGQVADGAIQVRAVVEAGHHHDLRVRLDPQASQAAELSHHVGGGGVAEETAAQVRVSGVDRDVERAEALLANALPVTLVQVGQREVVAEEKGVAIVVVFDVQGAAQARRHLGDEAERAAVVATADAIESGMGELQAQRLVVAPFRLDGELLPAPAHPQRQVLLGPVEPHVNRIAQTVAVDGKQFIT